MERYLKPSKRALKAQEVIDNLVTLLQYYMYGTLELKRIVREDVQFLEDYLNEISEDHKTYNIKFATKLKAQWKKDMKKKDKVIEELVHKIEELE